MNSARRSHAKNVSVDSRRGSACRCDIVPYRRRLTFEPLEDRRLLHFGNGIELPPAPEWSDAIEQQYAAGLASGGGGAGADTTTIVWANRNTFSGTNDNMFDDVFGTSAGAAQIVVDAAISFWDRVITNWNRSDATTTLQVNITMDPTTSGFGASGAPAATAPADGKPRTGSISINFGNSDGNANSANGWFLDSTPYSFAEFDGTILSPFAAQPTTNLGSDFFSVVTAELTHVLGLISPKAGGTGANFVGYELIDSGDVLTTGRRDNAEGGGTSGFYYIFNGPTIDHLLTSYNSGDSDSDSWGNAIHTAGGTANETVFGFNYRGTEDDGNASYNAERTLPSWVTAHILADAYGYTIENPAKFGTFYARKKVDGTLLITGLDGSNDHFGIRRVGDVIYVDVDLQNDVPGSGPFEGVGDYGIWTSEFDWADITSIEINTGSGNDVISLSSLDLAIPITITAGDGSDVLEVNGTGGYDNIQVDNIGLSSTNLTVDVYSGIETMYFYTGGGATDFTMSAKDGTTTGVYFFGSGAADTLNIHELPAGLTTEAYTFGGADTISLAPSAPFSIGALNSPILVDGGSGGDTLNVGSGGLHAVSGLVTFNAGSLGEGNAINLYDGANPFFVDYTIGETSITRSDPFFFGGVNYSGVGSVFLDATQGPNMVTINATSISSATVNGNGGDDNFIIGNGNNLAGGIGLFTGNGGEGVDTLTLNDSLSTHDFPWAVLGNGTFDPQTIYLGLQAYDLEGYESGTILAGNGNNNFQINGTMAQNIAVNAGGGGDTIELNDVSNFRDFYTQDEDPPFNYTMDIDGGGGFNVLVVDDAASNGRSYVISPEHMTVFDGAPLGLSFDYDSFGSVNVFGGVYGNDYLIFGTSSDIPAGQQMTIYGSSEPDLFDIRPHDDLGNLTINGNLGMLGGGGYDTLVVNDTYSPAPLPINYYFYNPYGPGTTDIAGMGAALAGAASDVESIVVSAGNGNDTFDIDTFQSGSALAINGGGGDDTLNFGLVALSGITNMASFNFNGQDGTDTFNLNNGATNDAWTYNRGVASITAGSNLGAFYSLTESNVELMQLFSGSQPDSFYMNAVAAGTQMNLYAGGGVDGLAFGAFSNNVESIQGPVAYYGEAGGGHVAVYDTGDVTGDTFHLEQYDFFGTLEYYIGLHAGDNLFGPGGSLYATGLTNYLDGIGVRFNLGSGADTIYAQPLSEAVVQINANNPTTSPGDALGLALAQAQDYVITGTTSGNVTSSNLQTLYWTGIEDGVAVDAVAPAVLTQGYEEVPESRLFVEFSEDVSSQLDVAYLYLFNTTLFDYIPFGVMSLFYDNGTNTAYFTFPGYANGRLPGGDYEAAISGSLPDFYGNPLGVETLFTFTVAPPLAGDYDLDNVVGTADYDLWKASFGSAIATAGSAADGNSDGVVNAADYVVWRNNFGATRAAGAAAIAAVSTVDAAETPSEISAPPERRAAALPVSSDSRERSRSLPVRIAASTASARLRDDALLAWLSASADADRGRLDDEMGQLANRTGGTGGTRADDGFVDGPLLASDDLLEHVDAVFEAVGCPE